jgi:hypothetical protein
MEIRLCFKRSYETIPGMRNLFLLLVLLAGSLPAVNAVAANFFQNAAYESMQNGYIFSGVNPANGSPGLWMGHFNEAETWMLMNDGTIRRTRQLGKCLRPNNYQIEVMVKRYGWTSFGLELADCTAPELRPGWRLTAASPRTVAIKHDLWPAGCLEYTMDDDGNLSPQYQMNSCWGPYMEGLSPSQQLSGQWILH